MTAFIFLNLSNHPVAEWQQDQIDQATQLALNDFKKKLLLTHEQMEEHSLNAFMSSIQVKIEDYPFPNINPLFTGSLYEYAQEHVLEIEKKYINQQIICAMVMGEMSLCFALVVLLQDKFPIYVATTQRVVIQDENHQSNKYFLFQNFREYPRLSHLNTYQLNKKNPFQLDQSKINLIKSYHLNLPYNELSLAIIAIHVSRYRLSFRVTTPIHLPEFMGNSMRGALGYALKKVACQCESGLTTAQNCSFHLLYDEDITLIQDRNYFRPFVIHVPAISFDTQFFEIGQEITIEFSLFGKAHIHLKNILLAMRLMMKEGLGKKIDQKQGKAKLEMIYRLFPDEKILYHYQDIAPIYQALAPLIEYMPISCSRVYPLYASQLRIDFLTPMRIVRESQLIGAMDFKLEDLVRTIFRRMDGYFRYEKGLSPPFTYTYYLNIANTVHLKKISLINIQLSHWSNRKERKLNRDGFIGAIEITGEQLYELAPLLWIGQFLNGGKNAMEGYGHFILRS